MDRATLPNLTAAKVASFASLETSCAVGSLNVEMKVVPGETRIALPRPFVEVVRMRNVEVGPLKLINA